MIWAIAGFFIICWVMKANFERSRVIKAKNQFVSPSEWMRLSRKEKAEVRAHRAWMRKTHGKGKK